MYEILQQKDNIPCGVHPILETQNFTCAPYLLLYCANDGHLIPLGNDHFDFHQFFFVFINKN